jgi:hypothetical protein
MEIRSTQWFARHREDFVCENCSMVIKGNGFTDHCPDCLFSKHVDINPGDRAENCRGMMAPIRALHNRKNFVLYYKCLKCGVNKRVNASAEDNNKLLLSLTASVSKRSR